MSIFSILRLYYRIMLNGFRVLYMTLISYPYRKMTMYTWLTMRVKASKPKILFAVIAVCLIIILLWPKSTTKLHTDLIVAPGWLSSSNLHNKATDSCLNYKLEEFRKDSESLNTIISRLPLNKDEKYYPSFIGNGNIGVFIDGALYIKYGKYLDVHVPYYPSIHTVYKGVTQSVADVLNIVKGTVHKIHCFQVTTDTHAIATSVMYAHRARPSVIVQEIRLQNPTESDVTFELKWSGPSTDWFGVQTEQFKLSTDRSCSLSYGSVMTYGDSKVKIVIAVAQTRTKEQITVQKSENKNVKVITSVQYRITAPGENVTQLYNEIKAKAKEDLSAVAGVDQLTLRREHSTIWENLWSSGFYISHSKAQGTVNGAQINATMYYVLSNVPSPIHEPQRKKEEKQALLQSLNFPDRCYEGHHTLQNIKLWKDFRSVDDVLQLVNLWLLTLSKQGCQQLISAGADGVIQAMILSYGAFRFSNDHLEFGMQPSDLHRDFIFHRINYGNDTHLNVSVLLSEGNKAKLYVSLDRSNKPYYACDAGCLDTYQPLDKTPVSFPVKLTSPITAILYITADRQHMEELKHTIHVKEINEAPAHEHNLIALHRHGHSLGGLPLMFWVTIGILIAVFHLFLLKLVYNEYCSSSSNDVRKHRYSGEWTANTKRYSSRYV